MICFEHPQLFLIIYETYYVIFCGKTLQNMKWSENVYHISYLLSAEFFKCNFSMLLAIQIKLLLLCYTGTATVSVAKILRLYDKTK